MFTFNYPNNFSGGAPAGFGLGRPTGFGQLSYLTPMGFQNDNTLPMTSNFGSQDSVNLSSPFGFGSDLSSFFGTNESQNRNNNFPGGFPGSFQGSNNSGGGYGGFGFPGTYQVADNSGGGYGGFGFSGGGFNTGNSSLNSAFGLLGGASGQQNWLLQQEQGLANSGFHGGGNGHSNGNGGQTASSGGNEPLTVNAYAYQGSPVKNIHIEEIGNYNNQATGNFGAINRYEESETLSSAHPQKQYHVTVTWGNGASYSNVVNNTGELTVPGPG